MPTVSVIMPNYNHAPYLKQRLESILNQTYQDFELILIDDCSTDNSIAILNQFAKNTKVNQFITNEKNSGNPFKQWHTGIKFAKGKYFWIAESDDYCDEKFLENLVKELEVNTKVGLVFCQSLKVNESNTITGSWLNWTEDLNSELFKHNFTYGEIKFIEDFLIHKNVIPNASAVVFRRNTYDYVGGVNYDIKYCGDWFLWLKIAAVSDIAFLSEPLNYFRFHNESVIYKAVHFSENNGIYPERYQLTMRKLFADWSKNNKLYLNNILSKNNLYISQEYLLQTEWYLENNKRLLSINAAINYLLLTKDIHYLKSILKTLIRMLKKKEITGRY